MKKSALLIFLGIILKTSVSNPIVPPPIISEIYFNGYDIQIEIYVEDYLWFDFDDLYLLSSTDSVQFVPGIIVTPGEVLVLDQSDFVDDFNVNSEGDFIILKGDFETYQFISFGNYPGAQVPAPSSDQSIAFHRLFDPYYMEYDYIMGIEQPPSIGLDPFIINATGQFNLKVVDLNNTPVDSASIDFTYYPHYMYNWFTNSNGELLSPGLFCRKHNFTVYKDSYSTFFQVMVYPFDTVEVLVQMDTVFVGVPEYSNFPNPIIDITSFSINIPEGLVFSNGFLNIYSLNGKQVDKIKITHRQQEITWSSRGIEPGIYIYNLVLDGKVFGSKKLVIQ